MSVNMKILPYDVEYEYLFIINREFNTLSEKMSATPHAWPLNAVTHRENLKNSYYASKKIDLIKEYENALATHVINATKIISLRMNIDYSDSLKKAIETERNKLNFKCQLFLFGKESSKSILPTIPNDIFKCIFNMNSEIFNSASSQLARFNESYDYEVKTLTSEIERRLYEAKLRSLTYFES